MNFSGLSVFSVNCQQKFLLTATNCSGGAGKPNLSFMIAFKILEDLPALDTSFLMCFLSDPLLHLLK